MGKSLVAFVVGIVSYAFFVLKALERKVVACEDSLGHAPTGISLPHCYWLGDYVALVLHELRVLCHPSVCEDGCEVLAVLEDEVVVNSKKNAFE